MMAIDIAAMDAAQKLEFAQAVGSIKIAGGAVAAQQYFDVTLPTGYSKFVLTLSNVQITNTGFPGFGDEMAADLSVDGGATWLSATAAGYVGVVLTANSAEGTSVPSQEPWPDNGAAPLIEPQQSAMADPNGVGEFVFEIMQGGAATPSSVDGNCVFRVYSTNLLELDTMAFVPKGYPNGAVNLIRVMPLGNEDNPPTSLETISCDCILEGRA